MRHPFYILKSIFQKKEKKKERKDRFLLVNGHAHFHGMVEFRNLKEKPVNTGDLSTMDGHER